MKDILALFGVIFILDFIWAYLIVKPDPTDKGWFKRSGLKYYKDHGTGIEYVSTWTGSGLQPRLDKQGKNTTKE